MKKPRKNKQKVMLKKIRRLHAIVSMVLFFSYVILSISYSPEFLFSDLKNKFSALADETIMITAKVLGPPKKPAVSIGSKCAHGSSSNVLDWQDDENSTTFDVDRDGLPLAINLTGSGYTDTNILDSAHGPYEYTVTAHGPMGSGIAISDPVSITNAECVTEKKPVSMKILSIDSTAVTNQTDTIRIKSQRPVFSGIITFPNATIKIEIHSDFVIFGETTVNENGFGSWQSPVDIPFGKHTIFATWENPVDPAETFSISTDFIIEKPDTDTEKLSLIDAKDAPITLTVLQQNSINNLIKNVPTVNTTHFSIALDKYSIFENKDLLVFTTIDKTTTPNEKTTIIYSIIDQKGTELYSISDKMIMSQGETTKRTITLPSYIKKGHYRLKVSIQNNLFSTSKEIAFEVESSPALNLGGGTTITYPEILSRLGAIAISLLLLLFLWLFLFSREYWLYLHALRHITANNLAKLGLISLKKTR